MGQMISILWDRPDTGQVLQAPLALPELSPTPWGEESAAPNGRSYLELVPPFPGLSLCPAPVFYRSVLLSVHCATSMHTVMSGR